MAQPSSSHRERERSERSSRHHHHRTISSTTLLLVLSLVLAVLAVMLSLPATQSSGLGSSGANEQDPQGLWKYLTPKRTQALISREHAVAQREAEVARREAELLAGAPGGVIPNPPPPCPVCPSVDKVTEAPPVQTIIKEVFKEAEALTPPGWWDQARIRAEDILDRELKIAEREREISRREEAVNRREHDASRRESWIMEQLVAINQDEPIVEEEFVYESPAAKRKPSKGPILQALPPPIIYTETAIEVATETLFVTHTEHHTETLPTKTVTVPQPANTRGIASPAPVVGPSSASAYFPRTTAVEVIIEDVPEPSRIVHEDDEPVRPKGQRKRKSRRGWLGVW
ncbi:hypothetical protein QCA50_003279 [Cerrena zonata]|uniref:Transmembrane protein n=1 Tax=Cerrena zonata TaxID=2478898 RepID=A0AAW0GP87_9APHY